MSLKQRFRSFLRPQPDPVTGDRLPLSERASWTVQAVIRRWSFLGIISLLTGYVWFFADPIWRHPVTDQWNLMASYAAIFIEGVTAMALINQTRRDALVIREIRRLVQRIERLSEETLKDVEEVDEKVDGHQ